MTSMFNIQGANFGFWFFVVVLLARNTSETNQAVIDLHASETESFDATPDVVGSIA